MRTIHQCHNRFDDKSLTVLVVTIVEIPQAALKP